jgi:hypothetical protein
MIQAKSCPYGKKCLLLQKGINNNCETCRLCQKGRPGEYAIHVGYKDSHSEAHIFSELPALSLGPGVDLITIYCLSGKDYYSKEVISFKPSTDSQKSALYAEVSTWL